MQSYRAVEPLHHDGVLLLPGSSLKLDPEVKGTSALLAAGAILEAPELPRENDPFGDKSPTGIGSEQTGSAPSAPCQEMDPEIEAMFPTTEEQAAFTKATALAYAKDHLGVENIPGNAGEVKAEVVRLINQAKAQLYADKAQGAEGEGM